MIEKIKPLKKFSQNFLQNTYLAEKIVESLNCENDDIVVEIGGGTGVLTEHLIHQKCKNYQYRHYPPLPHRIRKNASLLRIPADPGKS